MENAKSSIGITMSSPRNKNYECKTCKKKYVSSKMLPGFMYCSSTCLINAGAKIKIKQGSCSKPNSKPKLTKSKKPKKKKLKKLLDRKCIRCSSLISQSRAQSDFCSKECKRIYWVDSIKPAQSENDKKKLVRIDLWSDENKYRWQKLRYEAFLRYGRKCAVCGATDKLHVDHIKPKALYPDLCWSIDNLQILCENCNIGKGYQDETDWRS